MTNIQARLGTVIVMLFLAIGFGLAFSAKADDTPSPEDYVNLEDIRNNQEVLEETREAYQKFLLFKSYNEHEVSELAKNGWCVKFDKDPRKVDLERCSLTSAAAPAEQLHGSSDVEWIDIDQFTEKDPLSKEQLISVLKGAGFEGETLKMAYAVARAESSGRPWAHNNNPKTRDLSYGIFQINMRGNLGPDRRKRYSLNHNDDLYHPETNAKIAFAMSKGGTNWRPWGAYTNGSYKKHLNSF